MAIHIKFYKFTDPETGRPSKDIGYTHVREVRKFEGKVIDGKLVASIDETFEKITEGKPEGTNLEEITEQEYDALSLTGENEKTKKRREKRQKQVGRFIDLVNRKEKEHKDQVKPPRFYKKEERLEVKT